jgi:hypothetical protein
MRVAGAGTPNVAERLQRKPGRPANAAITAPAVYRPNVAVLAQRKPGITPPPVYRPATAAVAAPAVYRPSVAAPLQRKPGMAPPPVYHPANAVAASVQRMEMPNDFGQLLGTRGYVQKPAMVMTLSTDTDTLDREKRYKNSCVTYQNLNCKILNDTSITFDTVKGESDITISKIKPKIKEGDSGLLVVTGHGNLQWMFGDQPGVERPAVKKFAEYIKQLERTLEIRLRTVVLDACWSAAELKDPVEGIPNESQARLLSMYLGEDYQVYGFNGEAAEGIVLYRKGDGAKTKATYAQNAIIFCNGQVLKGTIHERPGSGVYHSTEHVSNRRFYNRVFGMEKPALYRTNSFSTLPSGQDK